MSQENVEIGRVARLESPSHQPKTHMAVCSCLGVPGRYLRNNATRVRT